MSATVDILVATYNGEKFLKEQLDSILNQTYKNIKVIICDDGSTDNTNKIIDAYIKNWGDIFTKIQKPIGIKRGAKESFGVLLRASTSQYAMCCDQDDVWLPNKIEATLSRMQHEESILNITTPILVHTDLLVVDEKLGLINESFFKSQKLEKDYKNIAAAFVKNNVTGCTSMINRALLNQMNTIPEAALMHDWWLSLFALTFGKIAFIDKPLIKYRQHNNNTLGAKKNDLKGLIKLFLKIWKEIQDQGNPIRKYINQFESFHKQYYNKLSYQKRVEFESITKSINNKNPIKRTLKLRKLGFQKNTAASNIVLNIFIFLYGTKY